MTSTGEMASKAATEVATCEELPNGIETRIGVPSWISGTALALCLTILFRVFH